MRQQHRAGGQPLRIAAQAVDVEAGGGGAAGLHAGSGIAGGDGAGDQGEVFRSGRGGQGFYRIEGVLVKVYNPAKTVADCFKYRNKIGLDVAIEALKDCLYQRKATPSELWDYAKVCRMTNVMKPYVEAMQ